MNLKLRIAMVVIAFALGLSSCVYRDVMQCPIVIRKSGLVEYPYVAELRLRSRGYIDHGNLELFPSHMESVSLYMKHDNGEMKGNEFFLYTSDLSLPAVSILDKRFYRPEDFVRIESNYIEIHILQDFGYFGKDGKGIEDWKPSAYSGRFRFVRLK